MISEILLNHHGAAPQPPTTVAEKLRLVEAAGFEVSVLEAKVEMFEPNGVPVFVATVEVQLRGNGTTIRTKNTGSCPYQSAAWALSEEHAPDAAVTRAIGRCLTTLAPAFFAADHLGNADEVAATIEGLVQAIAAADTPAALAAIRDKVQAAAQGANDEQRARLMEAWLGKAQEFKVKKQKP